MKVAIISKTPLAAAPFELWKAIRKYTPIEASLVTMKHTYPDGRKFPGHLGWGAEGQKAIREADVWHINNYWIPELENLRAKKQPILAQFHSLPRLGNWKELWDRAAARFTISQPLHLKEYGIPGLPNIFDPDEYLPPIKERDDRVKVAFAPTSRCPIGFPCSKAYFEVKNTLEELDKEVEYEKIWIEGRPYEENLKAKRGADILIDDVTTGNFHRTSLEGAAFGCAVLNKVNAVPWVYSSLETLKETLTRLIKDPATLTIYQELSRHWILTSWHPIELTKKYQAAYEAIA